MDSLNFMIIGAQKSGTTALTSFLDQHPNITMSNPKEAHIFDAATYDSSISVAQIDENYSANFKPTKEQTLRGEATPIYFYLPSVVKELHRYNADLKVIVLLRNPVERAISHHRMEVRRGNETLPLWLALLLEPFRLLLDKDPLASDSAHRHSSYRARGLYSTQLKRLYQYFDKGQILLLDADSLMNLHEDTLNKVFDFLGVENTDKIKHRKVFPNDVSEVEATPGILPLLNRFLKWSFLLEYQRVKPFVNFSISAWYK